MKKTQTEFWLVQDEERFDPLVFHGDRTQEILKAVKAGAEELVEGKYILLKVVRRFNVKKETTVQVTLEEEDGS